MTGLRSGRVGVTRICRPDLVCVKTRISLRPCFILWSSAHDGFLSMVIEPLLQFLTVAGKKFPPIIMGRTHRGSSGEQYWYFRVLLFPDLILDERVDHLQGDLVFSAMGDDDIGIPFGRFNELKVHGPHIPFILIQNPFDGSSPFADVTS